MNNPFFDELSKQPKVSPHLIADAQALTPSEVKSWLETVDESAYTVTEWAESLWAFDEWALREGRKLTLIHMLEYLSCCAESTRSGVKLPLTFLLQEFLKSNGVE